MGLGECQINTACRTWNYSQTICSNNLNPRNQRKNSTNQLLKMTPKTDRQVNKPKSKQPNKPTNKQTKNRQGHKQNQRSSQAESICPHGRRRSRGTVINTQHSVFHYECDWTSLFQRGQDGTRNDQTSVYEETEPVTGDAHSTQVKTFPHSFKSYQLLIFCI